MASRLTATLWPAATQVTQSATAWWGPLQLQPPAVDVTVLGLVGGAPGGETPRVADSSAAGAGRFFHNSVPPPKLNRLGNPPRTMCNVRGQGYREWASGLRH